MWNKRIHHLSTEEYFKNLGLVDEYRLSVHPVILGAGKPLFVEIKQRQELKLTLGDSLQVLFSSAIILLRNRT